MLKLADLKVGDSLILTTHNTKTVVKVTAKTKTMITVGEYPKNTLAIEKDRFRVCDGYRVGSESMDGLSAWDRVSLIN